MAKIIKLTPKYISELQTDFLNAIQKSKLSDGKITFSKSFGNIDEKATVFFTSPAWAKIQALVDGFSKEVAWHALASRGRDPEKNEYFVSNVIVYPQIVTGIDVDTDQEEYQKWLDSYDGNTLNSIRFQGHSHVNMGVSPSAKDTGFYNELLAQLDDTGFYIFMIFNKRGEKMVKIYDMAKNRLFETSDVKIEVLLNPSCAGTVSLTGKNGEAASLSEEEQTVMLDALRTFREKQITDEFIKEAKAVVKEKTYAANSQYPANSYGYPYDHSYWGETWAGAKTYPAQNTNPADKTPEPVKPAPASPKTQETKPAPAAQGAAATGGKKKKGKRKKSGGLKYYGATEIKYNSPAANDDDDEDDPYGPYGYRDGRW